MAIPLKKGQIRQKGMQTEPDDQNKCTQFPEAISEAEAEKLWFQDETV